MLGLRKFGGCQIDLHQGEIDRFVCDMHADLGISCKPALDAAVAARARHIVLVVAGTDKDLATVAKHAMESIRSFIDTGKRDTVGRITLLLANLEHYRIFQDALFLAFPEEK